MEAIRKTQIFGWFCLVGGAALVAWGWFNLDQGRASRSWPTAEAAIRYSRVIERSSSSTTGTSPTRRYHPEVRFDFTVEGTPYSGDRVSFRDDHYGRREVAEEIAARYPVGSKATVYYPPDDPSEAVLEPVYDWSTFIPPAIGLLLFSSGAFFLHMTRTALLARKTPARPV